MFFKIKHFALKYFIVVLIMHPSKTPLIYIRHNLKHNIYVAKKGFPAPGCHQSTASSQRLEKEQYY